MENTFDAKKVTETIKSNQRKALQPFVYSLDWLTINLKLNQPSDPQLAIEDIYFVTRERGTNVFQNVRDYFNSRDELIFILSYNPYSSIIKPDFAQLQIANKWLYIGNLEKLLSTIFLKSNFEFVNLSRMDICCDFYEFSGINENTGLQWSPEDFIINFASGKVAKTNPSKFTLWGKSGHYLNNYHCLNLGDQQSVFTWKLYNKSKELREKHEKKYIINKWERKLENYNKDQDIWRLELSLTNFNKIQLTDEKELKLVPTLENWLTKYPYYFMLFVQKKFVFKNEDGKFIDFIKLPEDNSICMELSTNIPCSFDDSPTLKDKEKIINATLNIIANATEEKTMLEYIDKIIELIQEEDYYYIFTRKGYRIEILHSYFANKFCSSKFEYK